MPVNRLKVHLLVTSTATANSTSTNFQADAYRLSFGVDYVFASNTFGGEAAVTATPAAPETVAAPPAPKVDEKGLAGKAAEAKKKK
jgi:hypothetical protein